MAASTSLNPYIGAAFNSGLLTTERSVVQATNTIVNAATSIFTVAGAPVKACFFGIVSVALDGACNGTLQETTVAPAATASLSTTVAIDSAAIGTSIRFIGTSTAKAVLTPLAAGAVMIDPVLTDDCWFLLPIGTVKFLTSAARAGNIIWYMNYIPLSTDSVVSAV